MSPPRVTCQLLHVGARSSFSVFLLPQVHLSSAFSYWTFGLLIFFKVVYALRWGLMEPIMVHLNVSLA